MDLEDDRRTISSFGSADEFIGNRVHLEGANIGRVSMNLDELNSLKKEAISIWCRRVIIITILQLVAVIIEFISEYWYINALGVVLSAVGFYGAYQKASEAIFVYEVLLFFDVIKNTVLVILLLKSKHTPFHVFQLCVILGDLLLLSPCAFYSGYYLFKNLKTSFYGLNYV